LHACVLRPSEERQKTSFAKTTLRQVICTGAFRKNLGQFQGFNNVSHEYRINNIAAGGSINFMLGGSSKFLVAPTGNIGIGAVPGATEKLHVAGNVVVDGNLGAKYQDVAEWVETASPLEAGTIVIVDPIHPNHVLQSKRAYDTRVAGAVSAQPGLILGERSDTKVTIAQSGRVRVKVDATYGPVRIGDLLVTSPTAGYAMRSRPIQVDGKPCIGPARCSARRSNRCHPARVKSSCC